MRALVVDDSNLVRRLLIGVLRHECGFESVAEAGDGKDALAQAKNGSFDLVFLDRNMPEMLGIEALRTIRESDWETPVVMVTIEKDGARVVEALEAGANHYIIKPFEPEAIAERIKQVFCVSAAR